MASTSEHTIARNDTSLKERFIAAAEQAGIPDAYIWVGQHIGSLISAPIGGDQTIADVHAYASLVRAQAVAALPLELGVNPAAVTDLAIKAAITAVQEAS